MVFLLRSLEVSLFEKQREWEAAALERQSSTHREEVERLRADCEEAQQARLRLERQVQELQQQSGRLQSQLDTSSADAKELTSRQAAEQARANKDPIKRLGKSCKSLQKAKCHSAGEPSFAIASLGAAAESGARASGSRTKSLRAWLAKYGSW